MNKIYDLIVIGGGSAGLSAGIYAGRAKLNTLILEQKQPGGQTVNTAEVVNYPGVRKTTGPSLMNEMHLHALDFGVGFETAQIQDVELDGEIKTLHTDKGDYQCRSVIIATGASPRKLGFPGEAEFTGHGIGYCSTCDGEFFTGLDIFVIGGGFAAAEEAMYLTRFGKSVTCIVREPEFTCAKSIADKVKAHPKITVKYHTEIVEAKGDEVLQSATFKNTETGETFTYTASEEDGTFGIFIFVGYAPASEIFRGKVDIDQGGYIVTDEDMTTNVPGVFAAGDIRPKSLRQIVTAVSDGAIAATSAERYVAAEKERLGIVEEPEKEQPKKQAIDTAPAETVEVTPGSILTAEIKSQLQPIFAMLNQKMTLAMAVDPSHAKAKELAAFVEEIGGMSDYIQVDIRKNDDAFAKAIHADKQPGVSFLNDKGEYTGVKFHGIPGGHELNSFVLSIYNLAGKGQALPDGLTDKLKQVNKGCNIKVCVALSCHFCPDVVVAAQRLAMLSPHIEAEMLDVALFPELKKQYKLMSVPAMVFNDETVHFGAKTIEEILDYVLEVQA